MNERIQELYGKACLDARDLHPVDIVNFTHCMAEKFAELIVRECALQCIHNEDMDRIEKHFGIEE